MNIFENEITWLFICVAVIACFFIYFASKAGIEAQKTQQIELQLKIELAKVVVSTNNVEK